MVTADPERYFASNPAVAAADFAWTLTTMRGIRNPEETSFLQSIEAARQALAPVRELHKPTTGMGRYCPGCLCVWPCPTARLIYAIHELTPGD